MLWMFIYIVEVVWRTYLKYTKYKRFFLLIYFCYW